MKVKVNKEKCIQCGGCVGICPDVFDFDDDGFACAKIEEVPDNEKDAVKQAADFCYGDAIIVEE